MKIKIIVIALISFLLIGCGKSEEEKKKEAVEAALNKARAEQMANNIIQYQRFAIAEALSLTSSLKSTLAEVFSKTGVCVTSKDYPELSKATDPMINKASYINNIYLGDNCTINATFKDSDLAPDLKGQTLTLKMAVTSGAFTWSCSFSGANKNDLPSVCK